MRRTLWTLLLLLVLSTAAQAAPTVWVTKSLYRTMKDSPAQAPTAVTIDAAQGERVAGQVVLRSSTAGSTTLVAWSLAGLVVTPYTERYIRVTTGSAQNTWYRNRGNGPGWYPDLLVPYTWAQPIPLTACVNQPMWVSIAVPRGTSPGLHVVKLKAGATFAHLNVNVHRTALPATPALDSVLLAWNVRYSRQLESLLLSRRLQASYVNAPPLAGQGVVNAGFWMDVNSSATAVGRAVPTDAEVKAVIARYPAGTRFYAYILDESPTPTLAVYAKLKATSQVLQANGVGVLGTVPPDRGYKGIVTWGVSMPQQSFWTGDVRRLLYQTLNQDRYAPKQFTDMHPTNLRHLTGFLCARLTYQGFLYWALDRWNADPWNVAEGSSGITYPGEGVLVYPSVSKGWATGPGGTVIPSIRLEWLGEGAADFDLYTLMVAAGKKAQADAIALPLGTSWTTWTKDPEAFYTAHRLMLEALDQ